MPLVSAEILGALVWEAVNEEKAWVQLPGLQVTSTGQENTCRPGKGSSLAFGAPCSKVESERGISAVLTACRSAAGASKPKGKCNIHTRCCSRLCIWDSIQGRLNWMGTQTSEAVWWFSSDTQLSSAGRGFSFLQCTCCFSYCLNTRSLSRLPCGQYAVWNKDTAIFLILFKKWRFKMTSWYLWSCIFTGVMSSFLSERLLHYS